MPRFQATLLSLALVCATSPFVLADEPAGAASVQSYRLGLRVDPVSATVASQLGLPEGIGLTVTHVAKETAASSAGFRENDVVTGIKRGDVVQELATADDFSRVIREAHGSPMEVLFVREGKPQTISVAAAPLRTFAADETAVTGGDQEHMTARPVIPKEGKDGEKKGPEGKKDHSGPKHGKDSRDHAGHGWGGPPGFAGHGFAHHGGHDGPGTHRHHHRGRAGQDRDHAGWAFADHEGGATHGWPHAFAEAFSHFRRGMPHSGASMGFAPHGGPGGWSHGSFSGRFGGHGGGFVGASGDAYHRGFAAGVQHAELMQLRHQVATLTARVAHLEHLLAGSSHGASAGGEHKPEARSFSPLHGHEGPAFFPRGLGGPGRAAFGGPRGGSGFSWTHGGPATTHHDLAPEGGHSEGNGLTGDRPHGDRPHGDRPPGDRPHADRPAGDRPGPKGDRGPEGRRDDGDKGPRGDRPQRSGDRRPAPGRDLSLNDDAPADALRLDPVMILGVTE